ncbi:DHH family phosphoesterase [Archaeoglobus veneficus]|uniref:Phosphoesterase RecJ domain protein n=1 Tax=Archaeoglobus veneficus (strain DSM 11195 / SNP6) TaxID=693661 RepID=F2KSZ6_ARCVS|nr:DHH family phosphoesterase [Archaeoglobus veneficus]AEA47026.1 phosphoesterase RecJ domain protein [Archaeoglobus veneficus SNP6]
MKLIVHHWDVDGLCSAAIAVATFDKSETEWENCTPPIGRFELDSRILELIGKADEVYFLDLNMVDAVKAVDKPAIFIDHHNQEKIDKPSVIHVNPVLDGMQVPSASWVVSDYFSLWNHLSAIGAVGDLGAKLFSTEFGSSAEKLLLRHGLTREDALKAVNLIDSSYILMDRKAVEESVEFLAFAEPAELLEREEWIKNVEKIESEIEKAFSNLASNNGIAWIEFSSQFNIISKVARKAVWEEGFEAVIAVNRDFDGMAQVYVRLRNPSPKILRLISELKDRGINAGGKEEVMGAICPKSKVDEVIEILEEVLEWRARFS